MTLSFLVVLDVNSQNWTLMVFLSESVDVDYNKNFLLVYKSVRSVLMCAICPN